jgi:hypothetical protein
VHSKIVALAATAALLVFAGCAAPATKAYTPGIAVNDAGKIADADKEEIFAYYIPANSPFDSTASKLSENLLGAAKAKANLAVFGPDSVLTTKILKTALQSSAKSSLEGVTILYVGENYGIEELKAASLSAGANFRATNYSGK